jgi:hypothetical protein
MLKTARKDKKKKSAATAATGYIIRAVNWQAWLNIVLLFITLEIAALSIEKAQWINPQPSLTLTLVLSMPVTLLLLRSKLQGVIKHALISLTGLLVTLWQAQNLMSAPDIVSRVNQAIASLATGGTESTLFAVFLVLITWFFSYIAAWFLTRKRNPWAGASLGALVIIINLSNLTDSYFYFLFFYFIAAVLLIAHTRVIRRPDPAGYTRKGWVLAGAVLLCIAVVAGSGTRITPELRIPKLQTFLATRMLWKKDVETSRMNIFNSVPAKQAASTSSAQQEQPFGSEWHQNGNVNFTVRSPKPSYWRVHVYDKYTAEDWENSPASDYLLGENEVRDEKANSSGPGSLTYTVSTNLKTDIILLAGNFIAADNPALVQVSAGDVTSVRLPRILGPGEKYTVTSSFFSPSSTDLASSGGSYPASITEYYLRLPTDFPARVRELSENLTSEAGTPYEKVMAINKYLSKIPYSDRIKEPPRGVDPVENFLFIQKSGFCLYYASSMAVMLRSAGVPSRLAVGYLPGDPGEKAGEYLLKDNQYHAWPQVYFNGFGWVDLEATPGGEGSGVAIETPWVSGEAIAQLPDWDSWLTYLQEPPDLPQLATKASQPVVKGPYEGAFFFADELGVALLIIIAGMLIFIAAVTPVLALRASFYRKLWHVDRDRFASLAYDKMCSLAARVGLGPRPQQTPMEFAAFLAAEFPEQAGSFYHVAGRYVENTFGRRGRPGLFEEAELLKARCIAFGALLKRLNLANALKQVRR